MYTRQKKDQVKIGYGGYGGFGQVPQSTVTLTVGGTKIPITGPANEVGPASALASILTAAVSASAKGQHLEAQAALQNARNMLPATGSLRPKMEAFIAAAEQQITASNPGIVPPGGYISTPSTPLIQQPLFLGAVGLGVVLLVVLLKR